MKKSNLFKKVILPIFIIMLLCTIPGFYFINKSIVETANLAMNKHIDNDLKHIKNTLELKYKILFFTYGKSKTSYEKTENLTKLKLQTMLTNYFINSNNILFVNSKNKNIPFSKITLNQNNMKNIYLSKDEQITINNNTYLIKKLYFNPFNWNIVYLYDLEEYKATILKNQIVVSITLGIIFFFILAALFFIFKEYIKKPNNILLNHFKNISQGKYNLIKEDYDIKELDLLIKNINEITKDIEKREKHLKENLIAAERNHIYIKNVLNTQKSIIITKNNKEEITSVNTIFFKYFKKFNDLDDFKKSHSTITDFFVEEPGFIHIFENKSWIEEILKDDKTTHKVKLNIYGDIYFFTIDLIKSKKYNHTLITLTDITDLENQRAILSQYQKAIDKALIVSRTNLEGNIIYANEKLFEISKYTKNELLGKSEKLLRNPETSLEIYKQLEETINSENIWQGQVENIDKNGNIFYVSMIVAPIVDANHKIIEYIALRDNITDLVEAQKKATEAEQSKSMFLASMSHEIRTPLNAIIGFTKILTKSNLEEKYKKYALTIDKSAENLLAIVNDILDISKIENNSLTLEKNQFDPFEEFNSVVNIFYAKLNEKQINTEYFIDPHIPQTIIGDSLRIKQVLSNLISNAIKFTDEKGIISIRADLIEKTDSLCKILFTVKDSGIGIPKDKQEHIFTPFAQASGSTARVFGGTGLGLNICSKIIELHNSKIVLESTEGLGSKFSFEIIFETKDTSNISEKIENMKTCIVDCPNTDLNLHYKNLKEYLYTTTKNITLNKLNNEELLKQQDIVFICADLVNENVKNLAKNGVKFVIFTNNKDYKSNIENCKEIYLPVDVSDLFNILIESLHTDTDIISEKAIEKEEVVIVENLQGHILIAEDHQINQQLISILMEIRNLNFTIVNDGAEAVEEFKKSNFDLVLMDINMPNKNGIEATKEIREYEEKYNKVNTPIIALTANAIGDIKKQMNQAGMDGYLFKPIEEDKLDKLLNTYLNKTENSNTIKEKKLDEEIIKKEEYSIENAAEQMGGLKPEHLVKIVKNFASTVDNDTKPLQIAIDNLDYENIYLTAHKLKGAALNLKMNEIGDYARQLESLGGEKKNEDLKKIFDNLIKEIEIIKKYATNI